MIVVRRGIPLVIFAPSGTGKTTVCRELVRRDPKIRFSVSHTTRAQRPGERDGVDYHFVEESRFQALVDAEAFLEHAVYDGRRYGSSWQALEPLLAKGFDVLLEIDIQGAEQVARRAELCARLILLVPPAREDLERRLVFRGKDPREVIERRLREAQREFDVIETARWIDYVVVNDELERAVCDVLRIIAAERVGEAETLAQDFGRERVLARLAPALGITPAGPN